MVLARPVGSRGRRRRTVGMPRLELYLHPRTGLDRTLGSHVALSPDRSTSQHVGIARWGKEEICGQTHFPTINIPIGISKCGQGIILPEEKILPGRKDVATLFLGPGIEWSVGDAGNAKKHTSVWFSGHSRGVQIYL